MKKAHPNGTRSREGDTKGECEENALVSIYVVRVTFVQGNRRSLTIQIEIR